MDSPWELWNGWEGWERAGKKVLFHPTAAVTWELGGDTEHWGVQTLGCLVGSGRYLGHKGITKGEEEPVERSHPWGHLGPAESRP